MYLPSSDLYSAASSLGMIALAGYISSPTSSTSSVMSVDYPNLITYSQTQSQYINEDDLEEYPGRGSRTLWLKKPQKVKYGASPKIK